jgi:uncharacterized protein (DUF362 family)
MRDRLPIVALARAPGTYPDHAPFDPGERYPEYGTRPVCAGPNAAYAAVRTLLLLLGLDRHRAGTPGWNPLGAIVRPGDRVFIKPNLVSHAHRGAAADADLFSVVTHGSVVRAVADYAAIALQGQGEIVIGDNPSIDADAQTIFERTGLASLPAALDERFGIRCRVLDLRPRWTPDLRTYGFKSGTVPLQGDPEGDTTLDLGRHSRFGDVDPARLRGVFTDRHETVDSHSGGAHRYCLSNTILNADVFISVPKLKSHHKVGATLNVKGLVGANSNKNLLPHWRIGHPGQGGDEFPAAHRRLDPLRVAIAHALTDRLPERLYLAARPWVPAAVSRLLERHAACSHERYRGAWDGNDTCWRMAADLYELFVNDPIGWRAARGKPPLRVFSVVDGITAGEGDGPFSPTAVASRVVVGGRDLLLVDAVAVRYMDYDIGQVRYLASLLQAAGCDLATVPIASDLPGFSKCFSTTQAFGGFKPPQGWPRLSTFPSRERAA